MIEVGFAAVTYLALMKIESDVEFMGFECDLLQITVFLIGAALLIGDVSGPIGGNFTAVGS
jgi:hypothetical protein